MAAATTKDVTLDTCRPDLPHLQTRPDRTMEKACDDSTEPVEPLPKVQSQENKSNHTASMEMQKVPPEKSQRSLSYVQALRRRKDKGQLDSRGLWDFWNNVAMGVN
jgi:hypothetical protein